MENELLPMLPFVAALVFVLVLARRPVNCPNCGNRLSPFASPLRKTARMWRRAGTSARCGCETDPAGQEMAAGRPPAHASTFQWVVLTILLLLGGVAMAGMMLTRPAVAAPSRTTAPRVVVALQH